MIAANDGLVSTGQRQGRPQALPSRPYLPSGLVAVLAVFSLNACGSDSLILPREGDPATLVILRGDAQTGTVGRILPESLIIRLTDGVDRPIKRQRVVFRETGTATGARTRPDTATTDADGKARVRFELGTLAGPQTLRAHLVAASGGLTADFHAVANAGPPDSILAAAGDSQVGVVGQDLAEDLVATVTDRYGNPVGGVTVTWKVVGGGNVSPSTTISGKDGRLVVSRTLGPAPGDQQTVATAPGLGGSPLVFVQHSNHGPPASLVVVSGNNQSGKPNQPLANPLVVRLLDALGNGVSGAAVTWTVPSGGGHFGTAQGTTDGTGNASATWILGGAPGANVAVAASSGFAVTFFADAGGAAGLDILVQPPSSVLSGQTFPQHPSVQLVDGGGSPVPQAGVTCTVSLDSGGPSLVGTLSATTNSSGVASFTDLAIAGAGGVRTLRFSVPGVGFVVSRPVDVQTRTPSTLTIIQQPSALVINGVPLPVQPVVLVVDQVGVPMGGESVSAAVSSLAVALGGQATATTDLLGHASFSTLVLTGLVGSYPLRLSAGTAVATTNPIAVTPGPVSAARTTATVPGRGDRNRPTIIAIQSRDQSGNRVGQGGHTVRVTVSGPNPVGTFTATDNGDGTYTASYTPTKKGHDNITITLDGLPISGSPFRSNVH